MRLRKPVALLERLILSAVMTAAVMIVDRRLKKLQARVSRARPAVDRNP